MLKMELGTTAAPSGDAGSILDISIPVQATDTNGAVATTTVIVRVNDVPVVTAATTDISLTVGLQDAPTMDGDDDDMVPDDYDGQDITNGDITCVMLNSCMVMLEATDRNRDDSHMWMFYSPNDNIMVQATDDGVMITGLKTATAASSVYVWAVDEAGLPMTRMDDDGKDIGYRDDDTSGTPDLDESKFPAGAREIQVTVDPPPNLGAMMTGQDVSLPAQTLKSSGDTRVLGTVYNDPSTEGITLTQEEHEGIVNISFSDGGDTPNISDTRTDASGGVLIVAEPRNLTASRRTFEFKVSENAVDNNPTQFINVSIDITVSND